MRRDVSRDNVTIGDVEDSFRSLWEELHKLEAVIRERFAAEDHCEECDAEAARPRLAFIRGGLDDARS